MYHFINFTAEEIKPEFYLWLGDNTPHDIWNLDVDYHLDSEVNITREFILKHKYGGIGKVYPVIGNHESVPSDQYDIYGGTHDWILGNLTNIWGKHWFTAECIT